MRRQIRWTHKLDDGTKREVRVSVHGRAIKWQFRRSDESKWDYDTPPTPVDWDTLEQRLLDRYQRGHVAMERTLDLVRRERPR